MSDHHVSHRLVARAATGVVSTCRIGTRAASTTPSPTVMAPRRLAGLLGSFTLSAIVSLALAGCGASGDARPETQRGGSPERQTAAQLRRLGLANGTPAKVSQACKSAARRTTLEVVCPPIAPHGRRHTIQYAGRLGGRTGPRDSYSIHLSNSPLRRVTDRSQHGHWAVEAAAESPKLRAGIVMEDRVENCRFRRRKGLNTPKGPCAPVEKSITVADTPVTEYRMPGFPTGGMHGGHVVFMWQGREAAYLVSVHDPANRARGLAITDGLVRATR